jgi:hypothetical protein
MTAFGEKVGNFFGMAFERKLERIKTSQSAFIEEAFI